MLKGRSGPTSPPCVDSWPERFPSASLHHWTQWFGWTPRQRQHSWIYQRFLLLVTNGEGCEGFVSVMPALLCQWLESDSPPSRRSSSWQRQEWSATVWLYLNASVDTKVQASPQLCLDSEGWPLVLWNLSRLQVLIISQSSAKPFRHGLHSMGYEIPTIRLHDASRILALSLTRGSQCFLNHSKSPPRGGFAPIGFMTGLSDSTPVQAVSHCNFDSTKTTAGTLEEITSQYNYLL